MCTREIKDVIIVKLQTENGDNVLQFDFSYPIFVHYFNLVSIGTDHQSLGNLVNATLQCRQTLFQ